MYGIPARCKPLSAAEEQVLLAVWDTPQPVTRREVCRRLEGRGWTGGTVLTFLTRLEAKGWLTAAKEANHNVYTPRQSLFYFMKIILLYSCFLNLSTLLRFFTILPFIILLFP